MTIKTEVQRIAETLGSFYYGRNHDINIQADNTVWPAIVMIEPDTIGFSVYNAGTIKRTSTVFIRFLDLLPDGTDIAEQADQRLSTIDAMSLEAVDFINAVINDDQLELVVNTPDNYQIQGINVIDAYDAHLCGVEIQLPLRLVYPEQVC